MERKPNAAEEQHTPSQQSALTSNEGKKDSVPSRPKPRVPYMSKPPAEGMMS